MQLTVMTWNVENLFRPGTDAGPDSDAVYQKKLETLARTITDLGPDILALQEIGSADSLQDLRQALGGAYPHRELSKHPDGRGIRVGFLSQHELTAPKQVVAFAPNVCSRSRTSAAHPSPACAVGRPGSRPRSMA